MQSKFFIKGYRKAKIYVWLAEGEAGKNYRGPTVQKGGRGSGTLHMFLSFSVVILFIDLQINI